MIEKKDELPDAHTLPLFSLPDEILALMIKFKIKSEFNNPIFKEFGFLKVPFFRIFSHFGIGDIRGMTYIILVNQPEGTFRINKRGMVGPSPLEVVNIAEKNRIDNVLFIFFCILTQDDIAEITNPFNNGNHFCKIIVWDISDITHYLGYNPFNALDFYKNLLDNLEDSQELLKDFQEDSIENLHMKYGEITLFLGAGVSKNFKIPSWEELIDKLTIESYSLLLKDKINRDEIRQIIEYKKNSPNLRGETDPFFNNLHQIETSVFKTLYSEDFVKILKKSLYEDFDDSLPSSNILSGIVDFCIPKKVGNTSEMDTVNSIITYNYDNILEKNFSEKGYSEYQILFERKDTPHHNKVNIYHVHGFLPIDDQPRSHIEDIVLSSEDYHRFYNEIFNWSNNVQITQLRTHTCLFIGTSFRDPNMRRLLSFVKKEKNSLNHYAIMKRSKLDSYDPKMPISEKKARLFLDFNDFYQQIDLARIGIRVLWIDEYEEIPDILKKIRGEEK